MAAFTAIAVGIAAAATVGGAVMSTIQQGKSNSAARKQYAYERQLANNRAAKERLGTIRQARLAQGALAQMSANSGAADSSIALGALGSIQSQLNSQISFLDQNQKLANHAGFWATQQVIHSRNAQTWGAISQLGQTVFSAAGGFDAFKKGS